MRRDLRLSKIFKKLIIQINQLDGFNIFQRIILRLGIWCAFIAITYNIIGVIRFTARVVIKNYDPPKIITVIIISPLLVAVSLVETVLKLVGILLINGLIKFGVKTFRLRRLIKVILNNAYNETEELLDKIKDEELEDLE